MRAIEPDMVLGKEAVDGRGMPVGEIVDVGLYSHGRVKFLVVREKGGLPAGRRVAVDTIAHVAPDVVRLRPD